MMNVGVKESVGVCLVIRSTIVATKGVKRLAAECVSLIVRVRRRSR